jgi:5-methylthioadenosine/S-adenosylhomocysteine deaminase
MPLMPWLERKIWPAEGKLTEEDAYWGTLLAIAEMLRAGITTFCDMFTHFEPVLRAVRESGIRCLPSMTLIGRDDDAFARLDRACELSAQAKGAADGRITPMLGPHAPYTCPDEFLQAVVARSAELNLGLHIHVSETVGEVRDSVSAYGLTPPQRLARLGVLDRPVLAAHCVHLTDQDMDLLAEKRVGVAHNPGSNMKLASGIAPVPEMLQRGMAVGLGTDSAASNNNLDLLEEVRLAALLHKLQAGDPTVLPAYEALALATRGSARALHLDGQIGSLEPGKRADVIVVDLNQPHTTPVYDVASHLVYAARASDVRHVLVDGVMLLRDRRLTRLDQPHVLREAARRAQKVTG